MNMNVNHEDLDQEAPLDPEVEKVRKKMVRLLAVSLGIMMVGLGAVLYAILFKYNEGAEQRASATPVSAGGLLIEDGKQYAGSIDLPQGAVVEASSLDGGQMLLQLKLSSGLGQLWVYDVASDRVIAKVDLK